MSLLFEMNILDKHISAITQQLNKKIERISLISTFFVLVLTIVVIVTLCLLVIKLFRSMDREIKERAKAEQELAELNYELEKRVDQRTVELLKTNALLIQNMSELEQTQMDLQKSEAFLNTIIENIPNMIFVKDAVSLRFVRFNKAGEELIGCSSNEMLGKNDYDFFTSEQADFFVQKDRYVLENGVLVDIPEEQIQTLHKGNRLLHTKKIPIPDKLGKPQYLLGISEDITERIEAENKIKASLKEKEMLLREIHHRVKNNMQIISSLLSLQLDTIDDQTVLDALNETEGRIQSIAFVHEVLYQSDNFTEIQFHLYLDNLLNHLLQVYSSQTGVVGLEIAAKNIGLEIEQAVSCGLIVTELVTNALKYADTADSRLEICVSVGYEADNYLVMRIADNGRGLPDDFDLHNIKTLGLRLVGLVLISSTA